MTAETQFFASLVHVAPWLAAIILLIYIVINKLGPVWLANWIEERKAARTAESVDRASLAAVYERFIEQQAETLQFMSAATESIHTITRSLDQNTQQIFHLTAAVERGPSCPLPNCPLFGKQGSMLAVNDEHKRVS